MRKNSSENASGTRVSRVSGTRPRGKILESENANGPLRGTPTTRNPCDTTWAEAECKAVTTEVRTCTTDGVDLEDLGDHKIPFERAPDRPRILRWHPEGCGDTENVEQPRMPPPVAAQQPHARVEKDLTPRSMIY